MQGGASLQHVVSCELGFCRRHTNRNYRFLFSLGPDWFGGLGQLNIPSTLQKPESNRVSCVPFRDFLCEILYVDESKNSGPKKLFSTQKQVIHNSHLAGNDKRIQNLDSFRCWEKMMSIRTWCNFDHLFCHKNIFIHIPLYINTIVKIKSEFLGDKN